jgi:beta-RFAP synthase
MRNYIDKPTNTLSKPVTAQYSVEVDAPARLHLGFLDLHGGLGRRFGSIGLAIDTLATRLRAEKCDTINVSGPGAERALEYARSYIKAQGIIGGIDINLLQAIPDHMGLGSGTQMALAVGTAIDRLYWGEGDSAAIAKTLNRGNRSGIGIGAFDQGGFILDCGRSQDKGVPPVAVRLPFPEDWRVLLLLDNRQQGLHGTQEVTAFSELPEFPEQAAAHLCRLVMMQVLPGLLEGRLAPVSQGVGEIQQVVGDHFAPAQGGRFTSPVIACALKWAMEKGFAGAGQSSWGPTGFILMEDLAQAQQLEHDLKRHFGKFTSLNTQVVGARNQGAVVNLLQKPTRLIQEKRV